MCYVVILGLFDISCSEYQVNEHKLYNDIRERAKKGEIRCPDCNNNLSMHGTYKRKVILSDLNIQTIKIIQVRCQKCKKVHAIIPGFIMPNKQYDLGIIKDAVYNSEIDSCTADDSTIRRWRRSATGEDIAD